jgi:hypothetical protein
MQVTGSVQTLPWSASGLFQATRCSLAYVLDRTRSLRPEEVAPKTEATVLGLKVHSLLEWLLLGSEQGSGDKNTETVSKTWLDEQAYGFVPLRYLYNSLKFVYKTLPGLLTQVENPKVLCEIPVHLNSQLAPTFMYGNRWFTGRLDLVITDGKGTSIIIDHKTGNNLKFVRGEEVREQLLLYAFLAHHASQRGLKRVALAAHEVWSGNLQFYTGTSETIFVDAPELVKEATALVTRLVATAQEKIKAPTATVNDYCQFCAARNVCTVYKDHENTSLS